MSGERIVHVVEDDAGFRRSLVRLLGAAGFTVTTYESAPGFLETAPRLSAGCVLLDIRMPEMDGFELQARLNDLGFPLPIIMMTGHGDVQTLVRAIKAGAWDVVEKPFDDEGFFAAIERALALSGRASREREAGEALNKVAALSPHERKVLDGLMAGKPNKVIAQESSISERTVEVHRVRLIERLGIGSTAEAVRLAAMANLAIGNRPGP
jgi:two-component system response regulator FixJ